MNIRYYIDPEAGEPPLHKHGVTEAGVEELLRRPGEDRPGIDDSRMAIGQTLSGRYLKVIYVPDPEPGSVFVITAYDLTGRRYWHTAAAGVEGDDKSIKIPGRW